MVLLVANILAEGRTKMELNYLHKISLVELVKLLEENSTHVIINLHHLRENYQRKGIKRIKGYRDEKGNLVEPLMKAESLDGGEYVRIAAFKLNRHTATINMLITRPVKLVTAEDGTQITEVAGLLFTNVETFNNYTIISDGEVNVKLLKVKIGSKKVFDLLKSKGIVEGESYDFRAEYTIRLDEFPLVPEYGNYGKIEGAIAQLAEIKILSSILSAILKKNSDVYTPEQVEELQKHYLSKNLNVNFPTTTEYSDLQQAIAKGTVDFRKSYKVDIGNKDILNLGKLHSANKFLDRMYDVYQEDSGEKIKKPTFNLILDENLVFLHKTLSSRAKITQVDELMQRIFDDFLGIEDNGSVATILSKVGVDNLMPMLQAKWHGKKVERDEFVAALTTASEELEDYTEKVYQAKISPLVFYIGCTGKLPDKMDSVAQTAEEISAKYPNLQFSKAEKEGTFFELGDTIISVYPKYEYYTVKTPA